MKPTPVCAAMLLTLLSLAPAAACPTAEPATDTEPALVAALIGWIAERTAYDTAPTEADPPEILTCATGETFRYEGNQIHVEPGLLAAYGRPARRIFLVEPWSPDDPRDQARLLHELVHDVQFLNADWHCAAAAEAEAYRLTADWLGERGLAHGFDWFEVYLLSRCPLEIHP